MKNALQLNRGHHKPEVFALRACRDHLSAGQCFLNLRPGRPNFAKYTGVLYCLSELDCLSDQMQAKKVHHTGDWAYVSGEGEGLFI